MPHVEGAFDNIGSCDFEACMTFLFSHGQPQRRADSAAGVSIDSKF